MKKIIIILGVIVLLIAGGMFLFLQNTKLQPPPENAKSEDIQTGKWIKVTSKNTISTDGSQWFGTMKKGTENNLLIFIHGGGVSIDEYTDNGQAQFFTVKTEDNILNRYFLQFNPIVSNIEKNPFRNWNILVLPYSSADFHAGSGISEYIDKDGNKKIIYHNGYVNYKFALDQVKKFVSNPEKVVVAGYSAGGFGTALLADDIIENFPNTNNFTIVSDGAVLDFPNIASIMKDKWKTPEKIWSVMKTGNIVVDSFRYLSGKYGEKVKILFTTSPRDNMLAKYQNYIDRKEFEMSKESFDKMQKQIQFSAEEIKKLPHSAIYIWEIMDTSSEISKNANGTLHTSLMLGGQERFSYAPQQESILEWIFSATNGKLSSYGTDLLGPVNTKLSVIEQSFKRV